MKFFATKDYKIFKTKAMWMTIYSHNRNDCYRKCHRNVGKHKMLKMPPTIIVSVCYTYSYPVKTLLQDLARKGPFFLHPCKILQDRARSCGILRDLVGFCRNLAGFLHEIPARFLLNPTRSRKIPQDLERSCKILLGCKKKGPFLARSCKSIFTG